MDISVRIGKAVFPNPVTVASGTFGHAEKFYGQEEVRRLGALLPKTVTLHPREGNPPPRIVETPSGMINAIGIENPGAEAFIAQKLPALKKTGVLLIISLLGQTDDEFEQLAGMFEAAGGIAALELNLSCPNLGHKVLVAQDAEAVRRVVSRVKARTRLPVIAKLSPNVTDITAPAAAAQEGGADAVSLVNTFSAMAVDVERRRPVLGNITGGLSGPAIRPIAVHMVYQTVRRVKIPVLAMGGIMTARDALEFLIAGAAMVAVGTANFIDPRAPLAVLEGIQDYLRRHRMTSLRDLKGDF